MAAIDCGGCNRELSNVPAGTKRQHHTAQSKKRAVHRGADFAFEVNMMSRSDLLQLSASQCTVDS